MVKILECIVLLIFSYEVYVFFISENRPTMVHLFIALITIIVSVILSIYSRYKKAKGFADR